MEKILLKFDEVEYAAQVRKLKTECQSVQSFVDQINAISGFKMDKQALQNFLFQNGQSIAHRIEQAITQDLENAGISSPTVRNAAIKGDLEKFYSICSKLPDSSPLTNHLTIDSEGNVAIADDAESLIREACSYYIKTERGLEIYRTHQAMIEAMNQFVQLCPKMGSINFIRSYALSYGSNHIESASLNYDIL